MPNSSLNANTPDDWEHKRNIVLQLRYEIADNEYRYSYRLYQETVEEESFLPKDKIDESLEHEFALPQEIIEADWSPFLPREEFIRELDIEIKDHSMIIVETVSNPPQFPISWSTAKDAVETLLDYKHLYGRLFYRKGNRWVRRNNFGPGECSMIRFRAKLNDNVRDPLHKFSYNVVLREIDGIVREHEIDPDMRNPTQQ